MVNYDLIYDSFIDITREAVGDMLSVSGAYPSVIRARQTSSTTNTGVLPDYPYVIVDIQATRKPSQNVTDSYMLDDNTHRYENINEILINMTVVGGNSRSIADELSFHFELDEVLDQVRELTGGCVMEVQDIIPIPRLGETAYVDTSTFNVIFGITNVKDITSGSISSVQTDGDLMRSSDDNQPLELSTNIN